jgi:hypothetical protein
MTQKQRQNQRHMCGQRQSSSPTAIITTNNQKEFISVQKVLKKIQYEPTYSQYTIQQQIELAKRLSIPKEIRNNYLRTNFTLHDPPNLVCVFFF